MKPVFSISRIIVIVLSGKILFAQADEALTISAGMNWTHDDNLFRTEDGGLSIGGLSDSWLTRLVRLNFDRYYGQQRLLADVELSNVTFDKFSALNYNGKDIQLAWLWKAGPRWEGKLRTSYLYILAPYTDFVSSERNIQTSRRHSFEATWKMHPSWQVKAVLMRDVHRYQALSQLLNDRTEEKLEISGNFIARSGNKIGIVAHIVEGKYPRLDDGQRSSFDNGFSENGLKLHLDWTITGHTRVDAIVGWARRSQRAGASRTESGLDGKINVGYERNKIRVDTSLWRAFVPFEGTLNNFTTNTGTSFSAQWSPTSKIQTVLSSSYETRDFDRRLFAAQFSKPNDTLRQVAFHTVYKYRRNLNFSIGFVQNRRSAPNTSVSRPSKSNSIHVTSLVTF